MKRLFLIVSLLLTAVIPVRAEEDSYYPQAAGVVDAQAAFFSSASFSLTEPTHSLIALYQFDSEQSAADAFSSICEHLREIVADDGAHVTKIGIGRIGDDRCAYIETEGAPNMWSAIRKGPSVLLMSAGAVNADIATFTAEFLAGFMDTQDGERIEMPTMDDMPVGWEQSGTVDDITDRVTVPSTPVATP